MLLALALLVSAPAPDPFLAQVKNTSTASAQGRVLRHEAVVPAPPAEVWKVFASAEGLRTWLAPSMALELKTGGRWLANYNPAAKPGDPGTIENTVLAYLPGEMLAMRVGLTDRFPPGPRAANTLFTVTQLEPAPGGRTLVRTSMLGWGEGADWDEVYRFFDRGNAFTMASLLRRFAEGPRQWK